MYVVLVKFISALCHSVSKRSRYFILKVTNVKKESDLRHLHILFATIFTGTVLSTTKYDALVSDILYYVNNGNYENKITY
jgi:hypothetical protein